MINSKKIQHLINLAIEEDVGAKDITTDAVVGSTQVKAAVISSGEGTIAGIDIAKAAFQTVSKNTKFKTLVKDGDGVHRNQIIAHIQGNAKDILTAERTALNFLNHLSGIATLTSKYVEEVRPYKCKILDTRKTIPTLRELEKYAVRMGGGTNHRKGLYDMVLIKDNHLKLVSPNLEIKELIASVKSNIPKGTKIEIEVDTLEQLKKVYNHNVDIIMLDNMSLDDIKKAVQWVKKQNTKAKYSKTILLEVSGRINLSNIRQIAQTGVDFISVGKITHSAPAFDTSLEITSKKDN